MENLRIHVATWNVACKIPEENLNLDDFLELNGSSPLPDLYIIGLQEVKAQVQNMLVDALFDDPWTRLFKSKLGSKGFVKVRTVRLQGILLHLFVPKKDIRAVRDLSWEVVRTGFGGLWGNKGAVSIRLAIRGVSLCIVNSHLAAFDHKLLERVADYNSIVQSMRFPSRLPTDMIFYHDYVVWLGDHNFRIDESVEHNQVLSKIKGKELDWLMERDQMKIVQAKGDAFSELTEPHVNFPPTYKFIFNTSDYDSKRRPAWTDRILYKVIENVYENVKLGVKPEKYTSLPEYTLSDHKPVICRLNIKVMSGFKDRIVEFQDINEWIIDKPKTISLKLSSDVVCNPFDWIGIYKADYAALDEYQTFTYVSPAHAFDAIDGNHEHTRTVSTRNGELSVSFMDQIIRGPGEYCLLYITEDWGSVLGASNVFKARFTENCPCYLPGF